MAHGCCVQLIPSVCDFLHSVFVTQPDTRLYHCTVLWGVDCWCIVCVFTCTDGELHLGADDSFTRFNIAMVQQYFREEAVHQQHKVSELFLDFMTW